MAEFLIDNPWSRLFHEAKLQLPTVRAEVNPRWGQGQPDARKLIRDSILQNLADLNQADRAALTDLNEVPRPDRWCVSISHTHNLGGWVAVQRPAQIGWDVEIKSRIKLEVIERVCIQNEIQGAPHPAFLWPAKEAYYKALEDEQPSLISALTIKQWQALAPSLWRWQGLGPRNAVGLLLEAGEWLGAVAFFP